MKTTTLSTKCRNGLRLSLLTFSLAAGFAGSTSWADNTPVTANASSNNNTSGEFIMAAPLNKVHAISSATKLLNGRVLVLGGSTPNPIDNEHWVEGKEITNDAELYDPTTATFIPTGGMKMQRANPGVAVLDNGNVLVVGGYDSNWRLTMTAELYDPATNMFSWAASPQIAPLTTISLANGKALIIGWDAMGEPGAELYDSATATFTPTGAPVYTHYTFRAQYSTGNPTVTLLQDGRVLLAGGSNPTDWRRGFEFGVDTAEIYDPQLGAFVPISSMKLPRGDATATLLPNGKVLIVGGTENFFRSYEVASSAELYDPLTNTFSFTGSPIELRTHATSIWLPHTERVLILGGSDIPWFSGTGGRETAELYDPITGIFTPTIGNMTYGRYAPGTALLSRSTTTLEPDAVLIVSGALHGNDAAEIYQEITGPITF